MSVIEEDPRDPPQALPQLIKLGRRFLIDQGLPALSDGVPQIGAVLRDASRQTVSLAVLPHLDGRPRRVQGDGISAGGKQRKGLHACRRRARIAEQASIHHAVDIEHHERRTPGRRLERSTARAAEPRGLDGEKVPGVDETAMQVLLPLAGLHDVEEKFLSRFHRPQAGEQLIDKEALPNLDISRLLGVSADNRSSSSGESAKLRMVSARSKAGSMTFSCVLPKP